MNTSLSNKTQYASIHLTHFFLILVIFASRISLALKSIGFVGSLISLWGCVTPRRYWHTLRQNPIASLALVLYVLFISGAFYGQASITEKLYVLKTYLPLLAIGLWITYFKATSFKIRSQTKFFMNFFVAGATLTVVLGILNAWHWVNLSFLHHHLLSDPIEYPFGTFSFSLSLAAFFCAQLWASTLSTKIALLYKVAFFILTFFIFFVSHQRTACVLYLFLMALFGFQHWHWRGILVLGTALLALVLIAYQMSPVFHHRLNAAASDISHYQHGNPRTSTGLRLFFAKKSYELCKQAPIFGFGTGGFKKAYLTQKGYNIFGTRNTNETALDQPHNDYAYIAVQLGAVGLIVFLFLLGVQIRKTWRLPSFEKQCAQGLMLAFVLGACDTTLLFYSTSITDYCFFTALLFSNEV